MTEYTISEVERLTKEWRKTTASISSIDAALDALSINRADEAIYFTIKAVSAHAIQADLYRAIDNYKRLLQAQLQEIENKIASKFKE
jgi:DNA-binding transcriptional MerR regulator